MSFLTASIRRCRFSWMLPGVLAVLALLVFMGCHTWRPPPLDLAGPGWRITRAQAVWRPAGRNVELAGDLLAARGPNGEGYVQFSKGPLVLAEARMDARHWMATFAGADGPLTFSGRGDPPGRLAWCQWLQVFLAASEGGRTSAQVETERLPEESGSPSRDASVARTGQGGRASPRAETERLLETNGSSGASPSREVLAKGWKWTGELAGRWRLENPDTGEWLEGTALP